MSAKLFDILQSVQQCDSLPSQQICAPWDEYGIDPQQVSPIPTFTLSCVSS